MISPVRAAPPLRRLIQKSEADGVLARAESLLPENSELALLDTDGHLFAGRSSVDLAAIRPAITDGRLPTDVGQEIDGRWLFGLWSEGDLLGVLLACIPDATPREPHDALRVLSNLRATLDLVFARSLALHTVANETLERYREINLLYRLGAAISTSLDPEEIAHRVLLELQHTTRAQLGVVLLAPYPGEAAAILSADDLDISATCGYEPAIAALCELAREAIDGALTTGDTYIVNPSPADQDGEIVSILCAPLRAQELNLGVLLMGRLKHGEEFTAGDSKLVAALAAHLAYAVETARLHHEELARQQLERELAISREIQMSLLPTSAPQPPGWEFSIRYRPAREVGGDHYDFVTFPDDPTQVGIVIADVTGKGMPAALFMAFSRTAIRLESMRGQGPAATLRSANEFITREVGSKLFLTAFCATLDVENGQLRFANAGHDHPIWLRSAQNEICTLDASGMLLGAFTNLDLVENEVTLEPGDALVLYTDGVTEARNQEDVFFGEQRLQQTLRAQQDLGAEEIADAVMQAVDDFAGSREQGDDLTLVVCKRLPDRRAMHRHQTEADSV